MIKDATAVKQATLILLLAFMILAGSALAIGFSLSALENDSLSENPLTVQQPINQLDDPPVVPAEQVVVTQNPPAQGVEPPPLSEIYASSVQSVVAIRTEIASGTGWIWDTAGRVITNYHVVECSTCRNLVANSIAVMFEDGSEYSATVIGFDTSADIAVLEIQDGGEFVPLPVGNSSSVVPLQWVIAIGSPFDQDFSGTVGVVSAVGRLLQSGFSRYSIPAVIQTDAALNPGNSGGPLLDANGRVIGVNTQIEAETRQNAGIGFAVPVDLIKRVVPDLIEKGSYEYSWLGINGTGLDRSLREQGGFDSDLNGVLLTSVIAGSPADTANLRGDSSPTGLSEFDGDVIVAVRVVNSTEYSQTETIEDLLAILSLYTSPGDQITLLVYRDGAYVEVPVLLTARS